MAKVITTDLHHSGASGANITLDSSKNVTCENNLTVDGTTTLTGAVELPDDTVDIADLSASGTASSSTFLRGDNSWASAGLDGVTTGSGNVTITDGNLIVASGHGIDFSATADGDGTDSSSLFDDYEEGTFTPIYQTSNSDGGHSMGTQSGHYRKIGSFVWFTINCTWSGGSGGSGYMYIHGLPYVPGGSTFTLGHVSVDGYTCSSNRYLSEITIHSGTDQLIIKEMNNSAGGSNYNAPYDGSCAYFGITGQYTTTS